MHQDIHRQLSRFWFQRFSFPVSDLISIQVKGLGHCKAAVVVVLVVLQEEMKWPRHPQEVGGGVLSLWVSDHPHNTEVPDWVSVRVVGSHACSRSLHGFMGFHVLAARPTQMSINLRDTRPNRATCHVLSHCDMLTFILLGGLKGSCCCCLRKPLSSQEPSLNEQAQQLWGGKILC